MFGNLIKYICISKRNLLIILEVLCFIEVIIVLGVGFEDNVHKPQQFLVDVDLVQ